MSAVFRGVDYTLAIPDGWTHHRSREAEIFCKLDTPIGALYVTKFTSDEMEDADALEVLHVLSERPKDACRYHQATSTAPEMFSVEYSRNGWHHHDWVAAQGPHVVSLSYKYQTFPDRDELRDAFAIVESLRFTV